MLHTANTQPPVFVSGLAAFNVAVDTWEARQRHIEELAELIPLQTRLEKSLPAWAAYGPRAINGEGVYSDDCCGWPEAASYDLPPVSYAWRTVRVSPYEVLGDYRTRVAMLGNPEGKNYAVWRAKARAQARERMRTVIQRIREQRKLKDSLGITALSEHIQAAVDGICATEEALRELHETSDRKAALIMMRLDDYCKSSASVAGEDVCETMGIAFVALELLLPDLSGLIRDHAQFFVSNPAAPLRAMPFKIPQ